MRYQVGTAGIIKYHLTLAQNHARFLWVTKKFCVTLHSATETIQCIPIVYYFLLVTIQQISSHKYSSHSL